MVALEGIFLELCVTCWEISTPYGAQTLTQRVGQAWLKRQYAAERTLEVSNIKCWHIPEHIINHITTANSTALHCLLVSDPSRTGKNISLWHFFQLKTVTSPLEALTVHHPFNTHITSPRVSTTHQLFSSLHPCDTFVLANTIIALPSTIIQYAPRYNDPWKPSF